MAYTQNDLDTLRKAMTSGMLRVKFSTPGGADRDVTYRSLAEMREMERVILRELGQTSAQRVYPTFGSGL